MAKLFKNCPKCNGIQTYTQKGHLNYAIKKNLICKSCGCKNRDYSSYRTEEFKNWMRKFRLEQKIVHSAETKEKIRLAKTGIKQSKETIEKRRISLIGKIRSEQFKKSCRIRVLNRIELEGIPQSEDKGAKEYIQWLNMYYGYNFKPTTFKDIGYNADGYDSEKHIWFEYDTPYHNSPNRRKKDLIRQNNIIDYFKSIGKPLKDFMRVNSTTLEVSHI